ncbi:ATP-binding protein [Kitasatospora sp. NPDC004615]|uniref:ATP-binding protein n=1 Tax=Kitasatospora sp. NPDC004615 TaxID=3364017 RepID=UPI0036AC2FB2
MRAAPAGTAVSTPAVTGFSPAARYRSATAERIPEARRTDQDHQQPREGPPAPLPRPPGPVLARPAPTSAHTPLAAPRSARLRHRGGGARRTPAGTALDDLVVVASELLANAARHAGPAQLSARLCLDESGARVRFEVKDQGVALPRIVAGLGDDQVVTGRGLLMVEASLNGGGPIRPARQGRLGRARLTGSDPALTDRHLLRSRSRRFRRSSARSVLGRLGVDCQDWVQISGYIGA